MKSCKYIMLCLAAAGLLGASCTERRTMSDPVPDGDTVEVVIPDKKPAGEPGMPEIIEVPDSVDLLGK